jgi:hypothetical protein
VDQLIELLRQIQEIAGVIIEAVEAEAGGGSEAGPNTPDEGGQAPEAGAGAPPPPGS